MKDLHRDICEVKDGALQGFHRDALRKALAKFAGQVVVIVRPVERFRSKAQNKYYWGVVIPAILKHPKFREWTDEQLHDGIKEKFLSRLDPGTGLMLVGSTANLSPSEFSTLKDEIQLWAAEALDLYVPDPNEEIQRELNDEAAKAA